MEFLRVFAEEAYGIPPEQVVGSSIRTTCRLRDCKPVVIARLPEIDFIDDQAGKPVGIHKFIGRRPWLAFGNSDDDFQMLEWTASVPGQRLALLLHHDDRGREWAHDRDLAVGRLVRGLDEAQSRGRIVVSMIGDWREFFPGPVRN